MKKFRKGLCLFLTAALLMAFIPCISVSAAGVDFAASGSGTEASPYIIETADQLVAFKDWVNAGENTEYVYVKLGKDIVLEDDIDEWVNWYPIGTQKNAFYGCFDGDGHTVSNILTMEYQSGFFGYIKDSTIKNFGIEDSQIGYCYYEYNDVIQVEDESGGIAYYAYNSRIENCYNAGTVEGLSAAGIVNTASSCVITDCYNIGTVCADRYIAGIVISAYNTQIINCYNSGLLGGSLEISIGGIVESARSTQIINCYNTKNLGALWTEVDVGGIVAAINYGDVIVDGCYNTGDVGAVMHAGGIIGHINSAATATIINSYNSGDITCSDGHNNTPSYSEMWSKHDETLWAEATFDKELGRYVGMGAGAMIGRSDGDGLIRNCYTLSENDLVGYGSENVTFENDCLHSYSYIKGSENHLVYICNKCGYEPTKINNIFAYHNADGNKIVVSYDSLGEDWKYYVQLLDEDLNKLETKHTYETSLEFGGLEKGKVYGFKVYAYKDSTSFYSANEADVVFIKFGDIDKTKVFGVSASIDEERLNVSWCGLKGATCYYVYIYENGKQITVKNAGTNTSISTVDCLKPNVDYTIKVIAKVDGKYQSKDNADEIAGRIKKKFEPCVQNVKATTDQERLNVSWDAVEGAEVYYVYFYENGKQVTVKNAGTNTSISVIDALKPDVDYKIKVIARIDGQYQSKDEAKEVLGRIKEKTPIKIEKISAKGSGTTINVSWEPVKDETYYYVFVYQGDKRITSKSVSRKWNVSIGGLREEIDYTVIVVGYIDGALMLPENAIPVTVRIPATSPNKVYAQEHTSTSVKVVWQNINCANEYYVRMTDEEGNKKVIKTTEPSLPLKNLKEGGKYTFEVSVQVKRPKADGSFTYETMPYGAATQITMPTAINIPIKAEANENGVKVSWEDTKNADTYYIYEKVGDAWKVLITTDHTVNEINIKNVSSGEHTYSIIAKINNDGANFYTERFISNTITV